MQCNLDWLGRDIRVKRSTYFQVMSLFGNIDLKKIENMLSVIKALKNSFVENDSNTEAINAIKMIYNYISYENEIEYSISSDAKAVSEVRDVFETEGDDNQFVILSPIYVEFEYIRKYFERADIQKNFEFRHQVDRWKQHKLSTNDIGGKGSWPRPGEAQYPAPEMPIPPEDEDIEIDGQKFVPGRKIIGAMREHYAQSSDILIAILKKRDEMLTSLSEAESRFNNATEKLWSDVGHYGDVIEASTRKHDELSSRIDALSEGVATLSVKTLWDQRARNSSLAFWLSASVLLLLLIVIPSIAMYNLDEVLQILRHIGEAATVGLPSDASPTALTVATISRLVVITVPLAMYFWVIKLVVRFNQHSLALMEDARQRHTMLDTYFHLIDKQAASTEDRALVLAALFRPTPGQGSDAVEPPTFIDLVQKGMGNEK